MAAKLGAAVGPAEPKPASLATDRCLALHCGLPPLPAICCVPHSGATQKACKQFRTCCPQASRACIPPRACRRCGCPQPWCETRPPCRGSGRAGLGRGQMVVGRLSPCLPMTVASRGCTRSAAAHPLLPSCCNDNHHQPCSCGKPILRLGSSLKVQPTCQAAWMAASPPPPSCPPP